MALSFFKKTHLKVGEVVLNNGLSQRRLDYLGSAMNQPQNSIFRAITKYTRVTVTVEYKYSPDLIADDFYGNPNLYWIVTRYNGIINIVDKNNGLVPGRVIRVPDPEQVFQWLQSLTIANRQRSDSDKFVKV